MSSNANDGAQRRTAAAASTCPFCGLLCDDVTVIASSAGTVAASGRACEASRAGFARQSAPGLDTPLVGGEPAAFDQAVGAAASILHGAGQPLIGGLGTDVAGMRAAVELADRCGAVLDHANSGFKFRNLLAFQDRGAITTTLSEIRNRADLFVVVGTDVVSRFPRFFQRVTTPAQTLFGLSNSERRSIFIGAAPPPDAPPAAGSIDCKPQNLPDVLATLAALLGGAALDATHAGAVPMAQLRELARKMAAARYGVLVWAAPDLDTAHAELSVQAIHRILVTLNRTTRFSAVPLGGNEADLTADAVLLWQVGFPFRTRFASGHAEYDPYLFDARRMLAQRETDAVMWISTLSDLPVPPTLAAPLILLAGGNAAAARRADVFIPVGTPGIDHAGHLVRTDKVVTMRLAPTRRPHLPSAATVLHAISEAVRSC
jgi:formylmethanofuran dehydrogenase subunit B